MDRWERERFWRLAEPGAPVLVRETGYAGAVGVSAGYYGRFILADLGDGAPAREFDGAELEEIEP